MANRADNEKKQWQEYDTGVKHFATMKRWNHRRSLKTYKEETDKNHGRSYDLSRQNKFEKAQPDNTFNL
jgi:hypothetical protein